jgi:regulator of protease activity HflC (stomatin/prohibitin superfamily)
MITGRENRLFHGGRNMNTNQAGVNQEQVVRVQSGWFMLPLLILCILADIGLLIYSIAEQAGGQPYWPFFFISTLSLPFLVILMTGFFTLQPGEARVLVLFGAYKGTVRASGFHWGNPFYSRGPQAGLAAQMAEAKMSGRSLRQRSSGSNNKISLRARTLNGDKLKVNDKRGNPIEIAAVIVWRVEDSAKAMFDVDNYENYVTMQSESAVRHLASLYAYDQGDETESERAEISLRSNVDDVSKALRAELGDRLAKAGVVVDEARLTHLAYAPEIAQAMLRRQQAEAVIAARTKIVHGAVSMVDMALKELSDKQIVNLDDERKAAMVSNLMVVLCGEAEVRPVINTGTLYN